MWGWYKYTTNWTLSLVCVSTTKMMEERVALYMHPPPPGEIIPMGIDMPPINDSIHQSEYITGEAHYIHRHRSGGLSCM